MLKDRQIDLDVAKGLGIITVVWAHAYGPLSIYINQFHMPLFFFISGMLYKNKGEDIKNYAMRKMKALLIPFWCWNLLLSPVSFFLRYGHLPGIEDIGICIKRLVGIIATVSKCTYLGPTWFLANLFWVSVVVHLYTLKVGRFKHADLTLLISAGIIATIGMMIKFPLHLSRTMVLVLFYVCGYMYTKYLLPRINEVSKDVIACVGMVVFVLIGSVNDISLSDDIYEHKLAFVIAALGAIMFTLRISNWMVKSSVLSRISNHIAYLGKKSIHIVIWHVLIFRLVILVQLLLENANISDNIGAFPVYDASGYWWLVYTVVGVYVSIVWGEFLDKILGRIRADQKSS